VARFTAAIAETAGPEDQRRRIGAFAMASPTVSEAKRRAVIAARLPVSTWPEREMRLPAVNAETGALVVFTRDFGIDLVDAVAASCAVQGVWPPVTINGSRYIDGGSARPPTQIWRLGMIACWSSRHRSLTLHCRGAA
jgi:NTE family protein